MQIKIKRFDKSLPLPAYKTRDAAGFDLCNRIDITIPSHEMSLIPLNVAMELPPGYYTIISPRSSMPKMGIIQANSIGVIDGDYCGNEDEFKLLAYNFTDNEVFIEKGTRLVNVLVLKKDTFEFTEVEELGSINRGGFGTTGVK